MKNVHTDNELIELFILGKLTEKEVRAFQNRRANDREFRRKYNLIRTFPEMMSPEGKKEFDEKQAEQSALKSEKQSGRFHKKKVILWLGISVVAILAGVSLIIIFTRSGSQQEDISIKTDSTPGLNLSRPVTAAVKDTEVIVIRKPEQAVEKAIVKEEAKIVVSAISLLTPEDGKAFSRKDPLHFSWTMKTDSFTRFYIVSERSEKVILWRGIRPGIREYTIAGGYLYPGKFYWYVGTKEQKKTFTVTEY